ncbi:MAG: hypothetical protein ACJATI_004278 [Halioglobus sp.]|jgi:hypothetical protein
MRLRAECKSCKKLNKVSSKGVLLRRDLEEKVGEKFRFRCTDCGIENTTHVNNIISVNSNLVTYILIPFGALFFILVSYYIGAIIIIAALFSSNNSNSTLFNKSKV